MAAGLMGSDGGLARYRLVIEPWLSALAHNVDAWAYQYISVPQILDDLFDGYDGQGQLVPAWRWDLADASVYPKRSLCIQYHEEYYASFGYSTPSALVDDCLKSVDGHVKLFKGFLGMPEKKRAVDGLKSKDWVKFTTYYNGGNWATQNPDYPTKMQDFYDQ